MTVHFRHLICFRSTCLNFCNLCWLGLFEYIQNKKKMSCDEIFVGSMLILGANDLCLDPIPRSRGEEFFFRNRKTEGKQIMRPIPVGGCIDDANLTHESLGPSNNSNLGSDTKAHPLETSTLSAFRGSCVK
jgi:hypothetical protein